MKYLTFAVMWFGLIDISQKLTTVITLLERIH